MVSIHMTPKPPILKKFGRAVRDQRQRMGLSQEKLAEEADLHRTYIGMIERAEKNVTLLNIQKISKALGVPISSLFKRTEKF